MRLCIDGRLGSICVNSHVVNRKTKKAGAIENGSNLKQPGNPEFSGGGHVIEVSGR